MAGITDYPYRMICKKFGAGVVYTEFVSENGIIRENQKTLDMIKFDDLDRPITARNGLKQQTTEDMFESLEKTKPSGSQDEELLDIPRFLRRQDHDLDFLFSQHHDQ